MNTIDEVRHANLLAQIAKFRSIQAFADAIDRSHSQVSQLKNRNRHSTSGEPRAIGDDIARHIEIKLGLEVGWMDKHHPLEGDTRPVGAPAQMASHAFYPSSPLLNWETILSTNLPPVFRITAPDDSMAPQVRAGQVVEFTTGIGAKPGDGVLVADSSGAIYFRTYRVRRADQWEAHPINIAYRPLDSQLDGLVVIAVLTAVHARWS